MDDGRQLDAKAGTGEREDLHESPGRVDAAVVRAALTRVMLVAHFDLEVHGREDGWLRGRACPACGKRWAELGGSGFCIGPRGWVCKACDASGDLLDLLARLAGLDLRHAFPAVLALGAQIAGVGGELSGSARATALAALSRAERERRREEDHDRRRRRQAARTAAPRAWAALRREHARGRRYLESRGLDVDALAARDLVRFAPAAWRRSDPPGDPVVLLHDWDGAPLNLVRRRVAPGEPRTPGLPGHPVDGTLVGHLGQIRDAADVYVTEGVIDALTAAVAWPQAVVLGAHGASQLPAVCAAAAARVRRCGGRLLIVPDDDRVGEDAAIAGGLRAVELGLVLHDTLHVVDLGRHADLNAAWSAGWRP